MPEMPKVTTLESENGVLILENNIPIGVVLPADAVAVDAIGRLSTEHGMHLNFDLERYPPTTFLGSKERKARIRVWLDGLDRG